MQSPVLFSPYPQMCSTPAQAQPSPPPPLTNPYVYQPEVKERKKLTSFTCKDCIEFFSGRIRCAPQPHVDNEAQVGHHF